MTSKKINALMKGLSLTMVVMVISLTACKDDFVSPDLPTGNTILAVAKANTDLNIFVAALNKTSQAASLDNNSSGSFTVFAPTDSAFIVYFQAKVPTLLTEADVLNYINNTMSISSVVTISALNTIVTYHIVSSPLTSSQLVGNGQVYSTLQGARLSISKTAQALLNANTPGLSPGAGSKVETVDLTASNGVIHTVNRVMQAVTNASAAALLGISVNYGVNPPVVTVGTAAPALASTNIMGVAMMVTGVATTILPNQSPLPDFTIYAPNDNDFVNYLKVLNPAVTNETQAIAFIKTLSSSTTPTLDAFTQTIKGCVIPGRILSTDYVGQSVATLADGKTVHLDPTLTVNNVPTLTKDQLTNAGIIHVMSGVVN